MDKELLKDARVRNAKANDKDQRLNDGEGLYIIKHRRADSEQSDNPPCQTMHNLQPCNPTQNPCPEMSGAKQT